MYVFHLQNWQLTNCWNEEMYRFTIDEFLDIEVLEMSQIADILFISICKFWWVLNQI